MDDAGPGAAAAVGSRRALRVDAPKTCVLGWVGLSWLDSDDGCCPILDPRLTTIPTIATTMPAAGSSRAELSEQMRQMRAEVEKDENVQLLLQGLRGQALNDDSTAAAGTRMLVVEMEEGQGDDVLPLSYQPERLAAYFAKRPGAVQKRLAQILSISSGFLLQVGIDAARGKLKENEVKRAAQLREIITSLGPFAIKLGQALSIRPDILSPRAMVELQKLCDKVPSFDSKLAMATIERELGRPVEELFSELTPEPVGASRGVACGPCLRAPVNLPPQPPRTRTTSRGEPGPGVQGEAARDGGGGGRQGAAALRPRDRLPRPLPPTQPRPPAPQGPLGSPSHSPSSRQGPGGG